MRLWLMPEEAAQVEKMTQARLDSLDSKGGDRRRYGDMVARDGLMVVILHILDL